MDKRLFYQIDIQDLSRQIIEVSPTIQNPSNYRQIFFPCIDTPRSYLIRELAKNIINLSGKNNKN